MIMEIQKDKILRYGDGRRELIKEFQDKNIFGLRQSSMTNQDLAFFISSWGLHDPVRPKKYDQGGFTRLSYIKTAEDKALACLPLLGTAESEDDIEELSQIEECWDYLELCLEKGFQELETMVKDASWDNDLLEARILRLLDNQYTKYFDAI